MQREKAESKDREAVGLEKGQGAARSRDWGRTREREQRVTQQNAADGPGQAGGTEPFEGEEGGLGSLPLACVLKQQCCARPEHSCADRGPGASAVCLCGCRRCRSGS